MYEVEHLKIEDNHLYKVGHREAKAETIKLLKDLYERVENYDHSFNTAEYVVGKLRGIQECINILGEEKEELKNVHIDDEGHLRKDREKRSFLNSR